MLQDLELGSFEPKYMQADRAEGSPDAPLEASKLQHRAGLRPDLTATDISFASMPFRSQMDSTSGDDTVR